MDGLFEFFNVDFLHDLLPNSWFESAHQHFGGGLTDEMIAQSIQEASDFFNMNAPMDVHEDWTTGVMTGMNFTENDDILIFNRQQMIDMGITDKEGFDLVMTHEGAHRALQGLNTGFTDHQEELCCDYLSGVRAGLNNMAEGKMAASLIGTMESDSHPDGTVRVEAIEEGVKYAHDYLKEHNGVPPTFRECLDHFHDTSVYTDTLPHQEPGHITLRPEHTFANTDNLHPQLQREMKGFTQADVDWYEHQARISSGSEQAHWLEEAKWARNHIHSYAADDVAPSGDLSEMEVKGFTQADVDWYEHQARNSSGSEQVHWMKEAKWARDHIHSFAADEPSHDENVSRMELKGYTHADVDWLEHQVRISSGSEQLHWVKELDWARSHCFVDGSNQLSSGFDAEHPMLTFEQLKNAGFSDHLANQILYGDNHVYSQCELYEVLYSEHPLEAYNQMMDAKAAAVIAKADELEQEISEQFGIHAFADDVHASCELRGRFGNSSGDYIDDSHKINEENGWLKPLFVDDRSYHLHEAQIAKENAEWHDKRANDAISRGDLSAAKDHATRAASYRRLQQEHIDTSKKCTK